MRIIIRWLSFVFLLEQIRHVFWSVNSLSVHFVGHMKSQEYLDLLQQGKEL